MSTEMKSRCCNCSWFTSLGKKFFMSVSGLALFGFVVGHLVGNLQIFQGQDKLNAYAEFLHHIQGPLWMARIGLLVMLVVHIRTSAQLTAENRRARPEQYAKKNSVRATLASRTMMLSGLMVFAYVVYHLLHFTFTAVHPQYAHMVDAQGRNDVYSMVVLSFQNVTISAIYIVANFLLAFHLSHGLSSAFQSLGLTNEPLLKKLKIAGALAAWAIFIGYAAIPLGVILNIVKLPSGVTPP